MGKIDKEISNLTVFNKKEEEAVEDPNNKYS